MILKNHTRIDLAQGGNIFKQGDYVDLAFTPRDAAGKVVDLAGKQIEVAIWNRSKGVIYQDAASWDATDKVIRMKIEQALDHGKFQIEFTVTDSTDSEYRMKFPSDEYNGVISITPSTDDIGYVGANVITVTQLRDEQAQLQRAFESDIVPRVDELQQRVEDGVGAFTEDTEVLDARMGETNLRQFNDKVVAQLAEEAHRIDTIITTPTDSVSVQEIADARDDEASLGARLEKINAGFKLTNVVKNDRFLNGTADWLADGSTIATNLGSLVITGNGSKSSARGYQNLGSPFAGRKLHVKAQVRSTNPDMSVLNLLVRVGLAGSIVHNFGVDYPVLNQWYEVDVITTVPGATASNVFIIAQGNYLSSGGASGKTHELKDVQIIDLTTEFGAGSEPDKPYMDAILDLAPSGRVSGTTRISSYVSKKLLDDSLQAEEAAAEARPLSKYIIYRTANDYDIWFETTSGRWVVYEMYRNIDLAQNKDSWRISRAKLTTISEDNPLDGRTESDILYLTSANSQWEYAIQPAGAPDFMGGFHGDEMLQSVLFLIDGKPIEMTASINRKIKRFEMVQHTALLHPTTPADRLGDMFCRHLLTEDGINVSFKAEWLAADSISTAYAGMLPALRGVGLTTKGRFLDKPTIYDVSVSGHSKPGAKTYGAELWNDTNNASLSVEFHDMDWFNGFTGTYPNRGIWISDSAQYNKVYPTRVLLGATPEAIQAGDVWQASFTYRVDCRA